MSKFAGSGRVKLLNSDGSAVSFSPVAGYQPSDTDEGETYNYYGYIDADGNWYIQRATAALDEFRYVAGTSDYSTNWTNRASLSYDYFSAAF